MYETYFNFECRMFLTFAIYGFHTGACDNRLDFRFKILIKIIIIKISRYNTNIATGFNYYRVIIFGLASVFEYAVKSKLQ